MSAQTTLSQPNLYCCLWWSSNKSQTLWWRNIIYYATFNSWIAQFTEKSKLKKRLYKNTLARFSAPASHFFNFAIKQCCLLPGKQGDRDSHKYSDYLVSCWFPPLCLLLCGCPPSPSEEVEAAALFLPAVPPGGREDLQMGENCWFWFGL